jgi:hypothetical protein
MQPLYQLRDDLCSHDHRRRPESEEKRAEEIGFEQAHGELLSRDVTSLG